MPALHARLRRIAATALTTTALVAGTAVLAPVSTASASTTTKSAASTSARTSASARVTARVSHAATVALHQVGDPYRYGGSGPGSFDCSGLVRYAYKKAGFRHLPHNAAAQSHRAHHIKKRSLKRGDLMFFSDGGGVYHAAIFLRWKHGHAVMVHAPRPGERVQVARPWTTHWFAATLRR